MSFLPGQRLSRCTCKGESHPGPVHSDGTYVGRSAPEIDVFEAQVSWAHSSLCTRLIVSGQVTGEPLAGQVSQSAQWAVSVPDYSHHAPQWTNAVVSRITKHTTGLILPIT